MSQSGAFKDGEEPTVWRTLRVTLLALQDWSIAPHVMCLRLVFSDSAQRYQKLWRIIPPSQLGARRAPAFVERCLSPDVLMAARDAFQYLNLRRNDDGELAGRRAQE